MGGIWRTRQVCAMADAHYAVVAPHNAQGPISTATCIQIGACTAEPADPGALRRVQRRVGARPRDQPVEVIDGRIAVPDAPGLGVDLNWAELEKHPYQVSNFLPLFAPGWERREGERVSKTPDAGTNYFEWRHS